MDDLGFILLSYVAAFGGAAALVWQVLRRGRAPRRRTARRGQAVDLSPRADATSAAAATRVRGKRGRRSPCSSSCSPAVSWSSPSSSSSAIDYYCNVDEVGHQGRLRGRPSAAHPGQRRRGQRSPPSGNVTNVRRSSSTGSRCRCATSGDPGGIFQECVPVVVHGRFTDGVFVGDEVEVKHSQRVRGAERRPARPGAQRLPARGMTRHARSTSVNGILGHSALIIGLVTSLFGAHRARVRDRGRRPPSAAHRTELRLAGRCGRASSPPR